ncbi:MAG: PilZ domain-containing protein [Thermodesulfobacteriota bacterium]
MTGKLPSLTPTLLLNYQYFMQSTLRRKEERIPMESAILPFLGSRQEDFQPFQYIVQDFSANGVRIAIPAWVQSRESLFQDDLINLHLPYKMQGQSKQQGQVVWEKWDSELQAQTCGIALSSPFPETYPVYISMQSQEVVIAPGQLQSMQNLLLQVIKDSLLLKRGLLIYLKHLRAYFTRVVSSSSQEYAQFQQIIFLDIQNTLEQNTEYFNSLYMQALDSKSEQEILRLVDIDQARKKVESELYVDLFSAVLDFDFIQRYLLALKTLEKKGYYNYNTLVMLYLKHL